MKEHHYTTTITWTGNKEQGTTSYHAYGREHTIQSEGKPAIPGTSDAVLADRHLRYNPEELLLASLSACHMLWYLHLCSENNVVVTAYTDKATGTMVNTPDGGGHFTEVTLMPQITIKGHVDGAKLQKLQHDTHKLCYIANSVNFPVLHRPDYVFEV